jgi:membrane-associated protein
LELLHTDLRSLIIGVGYVGIWAIIFAESGLLVGFFLPGDSLLFTAGFLASQGYFKLSTLCLGSFIAAVVGDSVGYAFGRRVGPAIFKREDSRFFNRHHLESAHTFYEKHGGKAIVLARFLPVIRTFAPILAGVGNMHYRRFLMFNLLGGFLWAIGLTVLGYFLGRSIPDIDQYLLPIVIVIILVSVLPTLFHVLRQPDVRSKIRKWRKRP